MRIVLAGFGTVGRAVATLLATPSPELRRHGLRPTLVAVADSRGAAVDPRGLAPEDLVRRKRETGSVADRSGASAIDAIQELEADVVVEATPTDLSRAPEAVARIQAAFRTGKHVVCVNKAPLAVAMPALRELAEYNRATFRFSGTVGGGTPVIDWAAACAEGDEIRGLRAVLNGTTNYILSRMEEGATFDAALSEAQAKGYAERDPAMDVDGVDTAIKLVILANAVLGRRTVLRDVSLQGIRKVPAGRRLRLVGEIGERISVAPREVDPESPLRVRGTLNAVALTLARTGEVSLVGRGAGGPETATAILRDLMFLWRRVWEK